ncbi:4Fe-4S dicluster domain-containing protein, partial [bacterium]|nr:4Fe-4S dicluster domain-containing protein [bacterium]
GCGSCVSACPIDALTLVSANDPDHPKKQKVEIDENVCFGCGVCVRNCKNNALILGQRKERVLTPLNTTHRAVLMAIERGTLQHMIFDNRLLWSHRLLAGVLGVILKLPGLKRTFAIKQVKSRYLEALVRKLDI